MPVTFVSALRHSARRALLVVLLLLVALVVSYFVAGSFSGPVLLVIAGLAALMAAAPLLPH